MAIFSFLLFQLLLSGLNIDSKANIEDVVFPDNDQQVCILPAQYGEIERMVLNNRRLLIQEGILPDNYNGRLAPPSFIWPLNQAAGFDYPSYYSINNFVDLDPTPNNVLDWNCGTRTYDGHRGIDLNNWPFWWYMMDNNQVEAIAAADGVIVAKLDGAPDHNCSCIEPWNVIMIEHADGYQSWYAHLKSGSLTTKGVGASVSAGEYLGIIGSAGCSSNPHLHFEVRDPDFNFIEPYFGPCNSAITSSLWADQKPLREGTLNVLLTHSAPPSLQFCPQDEITNFKDSFEPGEQAYFAAYLHDMQAGEMLDLQIIDADGEVVYDWDFTSPNTLSQSWWYWTWFIPENRPLGMWEFKANYKLQEVIHNFEVTCKPELTLSNLTITTEERFAAIQKINTLNTVRILAGGNVDMQAGEYLLFSPGFSVEGGGELHAYIEDCANITALLEETGFSNKGYTMPPVEPVNFFQVSPHNKTLSLKISPNPASDHLNLSYIPAADLEPSHIQLFDLHGKLIQQFKHYPLDDNEQLLNLGIHDLQNGLYLIRVTSKDLQMTKRFMKAD